MDSSVGYVVYGYFRIVVYWWWCCGMNRMEKIGTVLLLVVIYGKRYVFAGGMLL
jgi:hypothetical protein